MLILGLKGLGYLLEEFHTTTHLTLVIIFFILITCKFVHATILRGEISLW